MVRRRLRYQAEPVNQGSAGTNPRPARIAFPLGNAVLKRTDLPCSREAAPAAINPLSGVRGR